MNFGNTLFFFQRRQNVQPPMLSPEHRAVRRKHMNELPAGEHDRLIPAPIFERDKSSSSFDIERDKGTTVVYLEDETVTPSKSNRSSPKSNITGNGVCGKHNPSAGCIGEQPVLINIGTNGSNTIDTHIDKVATTTGSEGDMTGCAGGIVQPGSPKKNFYSQPPSYRSIGIDVDVSEPSHSNNTNTAERPLSSKVSENLTDEQSSQSTITPDPLCKQEVECTGCGVVLELQEVDSYMGNGPVTKVKTLEHRHVEEPVCTCHEYWKKDKTGAITVPAPKKLPSDWDNRGTIYKKEIPKGNVNKGHLSESQVGDVTSTKDPCHSDESATSNINNNNTYSGRSNESKPSFYLDNDGSYLFDHANRDTNAILRDTTTPPPAVPTQIPPQGLIMVRPRKVGSVPDLVDDASSVQCFQTSIPTATHYIEHNHSMESACTESDRSPNSFSDRVDYSSSASPAYTPEQQDISTNCLIQTMPTHLPPSGPSQTQRMSTFSPQVKSKPQLHTRRQYPSDVVCTAPVPDAETGAATPSVDSIGESRRFSNPLVVYLSQFQDTSFSKISIYDNVRYVCDKTPPGSRHTDDRMQHTSGATPKRLETTDRTNIIPKSQVREYDI